jgi:hypothetical protein
MKSRSVTIAFFLATFIFTSFAQENRNWLGGGLSLSGQSNGQRQSTATIMPEFGHYLNDVWAIGLNLGISTRRSEVNNIEFRENDVVVMPFVRCAIGTISGFRFFGQGELPLIFSGGNYNGHSMDGTTMVGFGIRPGITYHFTERWGFNMLMPSVLSFTDINGSSSYSLGINDGYTIQSYLLNTSISFIYMF